MHVSKAGTFLGNHDLLRCVVSNPITFLWTVPRSVSTSFERMMSARGDHIVFDEPFSRSYYYGPDRRSSRYDEILPESSADEVVQQIEEAALEKPVFVKDMAYQAATVLGPDLLKRFDNCFLVRHPAATLRSLDRHWPDFTDEETGLGAPRRSGDDRREPRSAAGGARRRCPLC